MRAKQRLTKKELAALRYFLECGFVFNRYYYRDGRHEKGIQTASAALMKLDNEQHTT